MSVANSRSEFFSFRKFFHFSALEREPAIFLFVFYFLLPESKRKLLHYEIMKLSVCMLGS